jgi:hydroxymethylbilane synthase
MAGNVDTRLEKLARGDADAIVLAAAGLIRLGREREIGATLDPAVFIPAPGQGTLVLEARAGSKWDDLGGAEALAALKVEREVARLLGADCYSAVGIHCDGQVTRAWAGSADGSAWISDEIEGRDASELARRMLSAGAGAFLAPTM